MSNWEIKKIGKMVNVSQGLAINAQSKHLQTDDVSQIPLLRIADLQSGAKVQFIKKNVNERFIAQPEDIIYTRTGRVGLVFRGRYGVVHNNCFKVNPIDKCVNRDFLFWLLNTQHIRDFVNLLASGAAQPDLTHSKFKQIKTRIPDLLTQEKIANVLSTYDKLIGNNNRRIEVLEQTAEEIYKEWFVRMRFPGYENTKFVKGIPEDWNLLKLEDVCELVRGISYRTKDIESNQGTPMMTLKSVQSYGGYNDDGIRYYDNEINERHILKENDLLMAITDMTQDKRVIGQVFLVPTFSDKNMVYSADLILLDKLKIEAEYFYSMLRFGGLSIHIAMYSNGANVLHLNQRTLNKIKFIVAPKELREKYSNIFKYMQKEINILENNNKNLIKQRDLLLPRLMNGTVEVK